MRQPGERKGRRPWPHFTTMLDPGGELGTLQGGKLADIVAIDGDLFEDAALLDTAVGFVMKSGRIIQEAKR